MFVSLFDGEATDLVNVAIPASFHWIGAESEETGTVLTPLTTPIFNFH